MIRHGPFFAYSKSLGSDRLMKRSLSLRKNQDFTRVYRKGKAAYNRQFKLLAIPNRRKENRYGFSISKKVGKAHVRNLLKRRLREIVRVHQDDFPQAYDYVFIVREEAASLSFEDFKKSLFHCLNLWKKRHLKDR